MQTEPASITLPAGFFQFALKARLFTTVAAAPFSRSHIFAMLDFSRLNLTSALAWQARHTLWGLCAELLRSCGSAVRSLWTSGAYLSATFFPEP
jgi:hypothetical protein